MGNPPPDAFASIIGGTITMALDVAAPWQLDIGHGMKPYRDVFFRQLKKLPPDEGDDYWQIVYNTLTTVERQLKDIPPQLQSRFPKTLVEACRHYGFRD